jgi:methylase of polypeptide subunit release factors
MIPNLTFENRINITWNPGDDGGGSTHYVDFLNAVGSEKKYKNGLEWCAGLSAVAFSLLDAKICENFVLMDIYEPALIKAQENAKINNIIDKVSIRLCDKIDSLPITDKFDLVVSNPPHGETASWIINSQPNLTKEEIDRIIRITVDKDWNLHKEFFKNITKYLNPNADLFISETSSHPFIINWAKEVGLNLIEVFSAPALAKDTKTDAVILHFIYETKIY